MGELGLLKRVAGCLVPGKVRVLGRCLFRAEDERRQTGKRTSTGEGVAWGWAVLAAEDEMTPPPPIWLGSGERG